MDLSRRELIAGSFVAVVGRPFEGRRRGPERPALQVPHHLGDLSLTDAAALIKARRLSPVELTHALLDRIDRLDARIGAFITVTREEALRSARDAEREIGAGRYRGPLHGIPFGVKDTHYTKGI